jgi:GT2 family glycosyltransferase
VVFDPTHAPVATVIVLAWRLVDELLDALEGLAQSTSRYPFNVTVVLNGADDSVRSAVLGQIRGATVVDAAVNLGFSGGCNLAASRASGEFLAFLNDDAVPEPAWLDNLIESARGHPDAGAIASRVHNPDGSVQEAGARVLAGPASLAMGLGADVLPSELSEPRHVDYGGAEALLVRRDLFVELGGFDQAYDPAYFEDADLCLRIRSAGWNVVYEPSAVVIHHQSLSTNEDLEWRMFASERSKAVFSAHWGPLLSNAARSDDPPAVVMPVPAGYGLRQLNLSQQVAAAADSATLERQRLKEFSNWLKDRLREASAAAVREETRRKELEVASEQLRCSLQAAEDRLARFEEVQAPAQAQQLDQTSLQTASLRARLGRRVHAWLNSGPTGS